MRQVQKNSRIVDPFGVDLRTIATKLKTMPLLAILFVYFIICPMIVVDAVKVPPTVFINKCCRIGEKLERNTECSFGGTDRWWPVIYMILKQVYFEPYGDAPRFFKPNESSRPQCDSPELISGEHKTALFSNGTLYIPDRGELIEKDNFCIDKDVALICSQQSQSIINSNNQPQNRTLVRKCCQQNQIYQTDTDRYCVTLRDGHEIIGRKLVENSANTLQYRYEFPQCSKSTNNIAIVGKFNESDFDESSGNLTLAEGVFQSDQYCLEHFNDTGAVNVHVFTCTDYLPTSEKSGQVCQSIRFSIEHSSYFHLRYCKLDDKIISHFLF